MIEVTVKPRFEIARVCENVCFKGVCVVGFCAAFMIVFTGCKKHGREGRAGSVCGISLQTPTEETSPDVADTTFKLIIKYASTSKTSEPRHTMCELKNINSGTSNPSIARVFLLWPPFCLFTNAG